MKALVYMAMPSDGAIHVDSVDLLTAKEQMAHDQEMLERHYRFSKRWGVTPLIALYYTDREWQAKEMNGTSL